MPLARCPVERSPGHGQGLAVPPGGTPPLLAHARRGAGGREAGGAGAQLPSASRGRRAAPARAKVRGRGTEDTRCPGDRGGRSAEWGPADRQRPGSRGAAGNGCPGDPAPHPAR